MVLEVRHTHKRTGCNGARADIGGRAESMRPIVIRLSPGGLLGTAAQSSGGDSVLSSPSFPPLPHWRLCDGTACLFTCAPLFRSLFPSLFVFRLTGFTQICLFQRLFARLLTAP